MDALCGLFLFTVVFFVLAGGCTGGICYDCRIGTAGSSCLVVCVKACSAIHRLPVCWSVHLSTYLSVCLSGVYLHTYILQYIICDICKNSYQLVVSVSRNDPS